MDDDPRHVFLHASDVIHRYDWGKTNGYQKLKDRELVPPPVMTHPNRWRLDQLLAWEEKRMAYGAGRGCASGSGRARPGAGHHHRPAPPAQAAVGLPDGRRRAALAVVATDSIEHYDKLPKGVPSLKRSSEIEG